MSVALVHQKDIQARGSICARYPTSCLIADLLCRAGVACGPDYRGFKILDLTYGEGRFWKAFDGLLRPFIVGFDIRKLEWHVKPDVFFLESCEKWRTRVQDKEFDLVVADPPFMPYRRGTEKRRHYEDNGSLPMILREAEKAAKHFNAHLLVHFLWRAVPHSFEIMAERWFQPFVRCVKQPLPTWFGVMRVEDSDFQVS